MRRFLVLAIALAAWTVPPADAAEPAEKQEKGEREKQEPPSPWDGQIGAGVDLWVQVLAPTLRGAFSHDKVPIWFDLRVSWEPTSRFGAAELGAANLLLPASRVTPVWTARWGVVADYSTNEFLTAVVVTSGIGLSWRFSDAASVQFGTELTASPNFGLPLPRLNALVNLHF